MLDSKRDIIKSLIDTMIPGMSVEELMAMCVGQEDELIKNLKSKKYMQMSVAY